MDTKKLAGDKNYQRQLFFKRYGIVFIMFGMILLLTFTTENFLSYNNILNVLSTISINGCIALGMCIVITAGGIDLTVGALLAWGSIVAGLVLQSTESIALACLAAVITSALMGLVTGVMIAQFNLFPFVATLAMQLVVRGLATALSGGASFPIAVSAFTKIGLGKVLNVIPIPAVILLALIIIAYILMHWTKFGRYVYAIGGNKNAAIASGVNVYWVTVWTYVISGLFTGISSLIMTAKINASQPNIGVGYETDAIAACVIGGTSFAGGVSTIPGTVVGIIIIGLIYNGMNLIGVQSYWQTVCKGLLIVLAVLLDKAVNKKR
ncbi:MAG: ABC transporter permease [Lachnospiraceae bacterium]|jgi:ribose/xylose/arabinose/galactoside ABC-type transport system permease subunit|uniref:ABC transporter permease n=1 Tax=Candidatus Merdisoma sp. JLR.KK006 TaxID=3112626 RepID=UPI002FF10F7C|nr:ABC transporter permease [Lachnospiraceae bacterium]